MRFRGNRASICHGSPAGQHRQDYKAKQGKKEWLGYVLLTKGLVEGHGEAGRG
jgi:hypothetical protein